MLMPTKNATGSMAWASQNEFALHKLFAFQGAYACVADAAERANCSMVCSASIHIH